MIKWKLLGVGTSVSSNELDVELYKEKSIQVGFVVLSLYSIEQSKKTIECVRNYFQESKITLIVHKDQQVEKNKDFSVHQIKTKENLEFLSCGLENPPCTAWNFVIFGGTIVKPFALQKMSCFIEDEKDIVFPVLDRKTKFLESSLNGLLIHKKAAKDLGGFDLKYKKELAKLIWYATALEKGYRAKGIVGVRLIRKQSPNGHLSYVSPR